MKIELTEAQVDWLYTIMTGLSGDPLDKHEINHISNIMRKLEGKK